MDSRFRGNDENGTKRTFYECINLFEALYPYFTSLLSPQYLESFNFLPIPAFTLPQIWIWGYPKADAPLSAVGSNNFFKFN